MVFAPPRHNFLCPSALGSHEREAPAPDGIAFFAAPMGGIFLFLVILLKSH